MRKELTWKGAVWMAVMASAMLGLILVGTGCVSTKRLKTNGDLRYNEGVADAYRDLEPKIQRMHENSEKFVNDLSDRLNAAVDERDEAKEKIDAFLALHCACQHKDVLR